MPSFNPFEFLFCAMPASVTPWIRRKSREFIEQTPVIFRKCVEGIRKNPYWAAVIFAVVIILFFLIWPELLVETNTSGTPRLTVRGMLIVNLLFPIAGGIIAIFALFFTYKRTSAMMKQTENSQKQIRAEQFKNAIDHLGSEKQAVILGGVHALHDLAVNNEEYRTQVFEILCSFIREKTRQTEYQDKFYKCMKNIQEKIKNKDKPKSTSEVSSSVVFIPGQQQSAQATTNVAEKLFTVSGIVIQTIIDKLFRDEKGKEIYEKLEAMLNVTFLRGMCFLDAQMPKAILFNADLQWAYLWKANLQGAYFGKANLQGAYLEKACFNEKTELTGCQLQGAICGDGMDGILGVSKEALRGGEPLATDLSGVIILDANGNAISMTPDQQKEWFKIQGAHVDDLPAEEVKELVEMLEKIERGENG